MPKIICSTRNQSFSDLDYESGELLAFDNHYDPEYPLPFILTVPRKMIVGKNRSIGFRVLYVPQGEKSEEWTIIPQDNLLALFTPKKNEFGRTPQFSSLRSENLPLPNPYLAEYAIAGKDAILEYLRKNKEGLDFYADFIESGELVTQRSPLEKVIERIGLGLFLKPQLRFKHYDATSR